MQHAVPQGVVTAECLLPAEGLGLGKEALLEAAAAAHQHHCSHRLLLAASYRHGELVRAMLPPAAVRCLAAGQEYAEAFDGVTILFAVEIVGDCWMAASGAFPRFAPREAALRAARQALDMVRVAEAYTTEDGRRVQIRVGLASGPVFASVISQKMAHVTLIGNTTNVAARMESSCKPMHIHVSAQHFTDTSICSCNCGRRRLLPTPTPLAPDPVHQINTPSLTACYVQVAESTAALLHPALANTSSPQHDLERRPSVPPGLASAASCDLPATSPRSFLENAPNNQGFSSMSSVQVRVNIDTDTSKAASCCISEPAEELLAGSSVEVADPDTGCTMHLEARGPQNIKGKGLMNTFWLSSTPSLRA
ncbi:guanylate cyclase domain-containing protein, partial [Haematococcus lacustris]